MAVLMLKFVKPLVVAALVGLFAVHYLAPLDAATVAVGALWVLVMLVM